MAERQLGSDAAFGDDLLSFLLTSVSDMVSVATRTDGRILFVNETACAASRRSLESLLASDVGLLWEPSPDWERRVERGETSARLDLRLRRVGASDVQVSAVRRLVRVGDEVCVLTLAQPPAIPPATGDEGEPPVPAPSTGTALQLRAAILEAGAFASSHFLRADRWEDAVSEVLERLRTAAGADRIYVYENEVDGDGRLVMTLRFEAQGEGFDAGMDHPENFRFPYERGFDRWREVLSSNGVIEADLDELPDSERQMIGSGDTLTLAIVPIFSRDDWWGFIGIDDCSAGHRWGSGEVDALRVAAAALGAAIERQSMESRLRDAEIEHRLLIERLPGVVYIESLDEGNADIYLSPQYEALYGRQREDALRTPWAWKDSVHPDDLPWVAEADERALDTKEPFLAEYRIVRPDGEARWIRDECVVMHDEAGEPLYWLGLVTDITEAKEAEERRQVAEHRYRTLVEQIPVVTYVETPEGEKEGFYISPQIEAITGYPPSAFRDPEFWASKLHPDDRERVLAEEQRTSVSGEPFVMEYRYLAADGRTIWLREESRQVARPGREPVDHGIIADITEAKEAEARLRAAEERYRNLVERVPAITYQETIGPGDYPGNTKVFVSPQFEAMLGHPAHAGAMSWDDVWTRAIHPDDYEEVVAASSRSLVDGEPYRQDYRVVTADGRTLWMHDESVLVDSLPDGIDIWHGVIIDVTEQKRAQAEMLRTDAVLQAVSHAAERFLQEEAWREVMPDVLARLGEASGVSRSYLFEVRDVGGILRGYETFEWCAPGVRSTIGEADNQDFPVTLQSMAWRDALARGEPFQSHVQDAPVEDRDYLRSEDIRSLVAVPVFVGETWWGYLGFDDCEQEREWAGAELGALRSAAAILGAAVARQEVESRLVAVEQSRQTLIERLPSVVYIAEMDGTYSYMSPQYLQFFGYSAEERLADPTLWSRIVHPDDAERVSELARSSHASGERFAAEYRAVTRDGTTKWISDSAALVTDDDGKPLYWLGMLLDITERRATEDDLRRHDAILESVGYAAAQFLHAVSWHDCVDDVLRHLGLGAEVSRAYLYQNQLGADGRLRSSPLFEWCAEGIEPQIDNPRVRNLLVSEPEGSTREAPLWALMMAAGNAYRAVEGEVSDPEALALMQEQSIRSIVLAPIFVRGAWWGFLGLDDCVAERRWSAPELDALRAAAGLLGSVVERQEADAELRKAEKQHRLLIEQLPAVVYIDAIDELSTALYMSPQVESMLGFTAEERLATPRLWVDSLHPDDRDAVLAESDRTNRTEEPFSMDYRMIARDGRTVWVRDESRIVYEEDGKALYWQGVMFDITDRKATEEELERALHVEREATERLRSLDEMKNTFLTAVSHDLRTPLAAVLGLALTLEREDIGLDEQETRDLATRIASNARKLDKLVTDLLDLDRLSRGILEPNLSHTDLGLLARKVVEEADYLGDHPVTVEAESVMLSVDTAKFERIVENLIANSVRHTPAGTRVWVRVRPEGSGALLMVEDEGPGVLTELREAVFEPFRQGGAVGASPGVGIGLSLVARFAELHDGRAWVAEREGGGASFRVFFPGAPAVPPPPPAAAPD